MIERGIELGILVLLGVCLSVSVSAGEPDRGRRLTLTVEAEDGISPMATALVQSKLVKKAEGYDVLASPGSMGGAPMGIADQEDPETRAVMARANRGDVVVHLSVKDIDGGLEVSIKATATTSGRQFASARQVVRGSLAKPGMRNRLMERAVEKAMPAILDGLAKHRQAPAEQGQVSPIDFKAKPNKGSPKPGKHH